MNGKGRRGALREPAEAYGVKFTAENEALTSQTPYFGIVDEANT